MINGLCFSFLFLLRETNILGIRPGISDTDRNANYGVFFFFLFTSLQIFRWQERIITCLPANRESNMQKNTVTSPYTKPHV